MLFGLPISLSQQTVTRFLLVSCFATRDKKIDTIDYIYSNTTGLVETKTLYAVKMDRPPVGKVEDLATLAKLDEQVLLTELKTRYYQNDIYVSRVLYPHFVLSYLYRLTQRLLAISTSYFQEFKGR